MPVTSKSSDKLIANNHLYLSVLEMTINMFYAVRSQEFQSLDVYFLTRQDDRLIRCSK